MRFDDSMERGHSLRLAGRYSEAMDAYRGAIDDAPDIGARLDAEAGLAMALRGAGKTGEAEEVLKRLLTRYRRRKDDEGISFALYGLGGTHRLLGRLSRGKRELSEALSIYMRLSDREGETYTRCALGGITRMMGLFEDSLLHYSKAARLAGLRRDTYGRAYAACGLGNAYRMMGDEKSAMDHLDKAEALYERIGDRASRAYTIWSSAMMMIGGNDKRAPRRLSEAERLFSETADRRGMGYIALAKAAAGIIDPAATAREKEIQDHLLEAAGSGFPIVEAHAARLASFIGVRLEAPRRVAGLFTVPPDAPHLIP